MNTTRNTVKKILSGAACGLLLMSGTAVAQDGLNNQPIYQIAQVTNTTPDSTLGMTSAANPAKNNTTPTNGSANSSATTPVMDAPATTTQVEVNNPPPAVPDVNVEMPDINMPNMGTNKETVRTETSEKIIMTDTDNNDAETSFNMMYLALFGILAIFLIAVIAMAANRREDYQPPRA